MNRSTGWLLGATVLLSGIAQAGVFMELSDQDVASGKLTPRNRVYLQQGLMRVETADGHRVALFRDNSMFILEPATKSYRVMDKATLDQLAGKANDAMAAMQARMANLSPEQRAVMERAMQGLGAKMPGSAAPSSHALDAEDTGTSGSAAGRSCHLWNVIRDGKPTEQLCVVPTASLPGLGEVQESLKAAAGFSVQVQDAMQSHGGPMAGIASSASGLVTQDLSLMSKIGGMPVSTRHFDSSTGALAATATVMTQWQQRSLDAAQFAVPADYVRKDLLEGHRAQ